MSVDQVVVLYFEDDTGEQGRYGEKLQRTGELLVKCSYPPSDLSLAFVEQDAPDLFLVDYELNRKQPGGSFVEYRGGTLASRIRELRPEHPIVLLSRRDLLLWQKDQPSVESRHVFDAVLYKGDVEARPEESASRLAEIANSFRKIRESQRDWTSVLRLLDASDDDGERLRAAGPPLTGGDRWQVCHLSRWINDVILAFPGILYDALYSATLLGVTKESFLRAETRDYFSGARYRGVFAPPEGRWWKGRLVSMATALVMEADVSGPINTAFAPAFLKEKGVTLEPTRCNSCDRSPADTVCYVRREPVSYECSVPYYPDSRPFVMDEARVSFRALRENNEVEDELIDGSYAEIVRSVRQRR